MNEKDSSNTYTEDTVEEFYIFIYLQQGLG